VRACDDDKSIDYSEWIGKAKMIILTNCVAQIQKMPIVKIGS
jgi:hypothetical protein